MFSAFLYAEEHLDKTERVKCNGKLYGRNEKHNKDLRTGDCQQGSVTGNQKVRDPCIAG